MTRIRTLSLSLLFAVVAAGFATAAPNKPRSVIHVITIQWKADATPEQIQRAIRAAENINYPGIKNRRAERKRDSMHTCRVTEESLNGDAGALLTGWGEAYIANQRQRGGFSCPSVTTPR
jgi:hypothetical protein